MPAAPPALAGARVRRAAPADLPALLPIWLAMMQAHAARDPAFALAADAADKWQRWLTELMRRPRAFVRVAHLGDGRPVGLAVGWLADNLPIYAQPQVGFVSELAVAPRARRRGVGTALVAACRRWFWRRGLGEFQLATAVWNAEAQAFWGAMGGEALMVRFRFRGRLAAASAAARLA